MDVIRYPYKSYAGYINFIIVSCINNEKFLLSEDRISRYNTLLIKMVLGSAFATPPMPTPTPTPHVCSWRAGGGGLLAEGHLLWEEGLVEHQQEGVA